MSNSIEIKTVRDYIMVGGQGKVKEFVALDGKPCREQSFILGDTPKGTFTLGSRYRVTKNAHLDIMDSKYYVFEYIDEPLAQKLENQYSAIKIYINNAMCTTSEQSVSNFLVDGAYFYVFPYRMDITSMLSMFARFFHSNKITLNSKSKKIKEKNDDLEELFSIKASQLYGNLKAERDYVSDFPTYLQNIRKAHFKRRTKTQEIIDFMRQNIQEYALETLEKIYQNNLEIMKTLESEKTKE